MRTLFLCDSRLTDHNKTRKLSTFFPTKFSTPAKISEISNFLSISNFFSVRFKTYWSLCKPKIFQKKYKQKFSTLGQNFGYFRFSNFYMSGVPKDICCYRVNGFFLFRSRWNFFWVRFRPLGVRNSNKKFCVRSLFSILCTH